MLNEEGENEEKLNLTSVCMTLSFRKENETSYTLPHIANTLYAKTNTLYNIWSRLREGHLLEGNKST